MDLSSIGTTISNYGFEGKGELAGAGGGFAGGVLVAGELELPPLPEAVLLGGEGLGLGAAAVVLLAGVGLRAVGRFAGAVLFAGALGTLPL